MAQKMQWTISRLPQTGYSINLLGSMGVNSGSDRCRRHAKPRYSEVRHWGCSQRVGNSSGLLCWHILDLLQTSWWSMALYIIGVQGTFPKTFRQSSHLHCKDEAQNAIRSSLPSPWDGLTPSGTLIVWEQETQQIPSAKLFRTSTLTKPASWTGPRKQMEVRLAPHSKATGISCSLE